MPWLHQGPDCQTKLCQTEPDEKVAGSIWLPGPEVCRKLEGSWLDCASQHRILSYFVNSQSFVAWLSGPWCSQSMRNHFSFNAFLSGQIKSSCFRRLLFHFWREKLLKTCYILLADSPCKGYGLSELKQFESDIFIFYLELLKYEVFLNFCVAIIVIFSKPLL